MAITDVYRIKAQIAVLKEVALDYQGKTIDNIIQQLEARIKESTQSYGCEMPKHLYNKKQRRN